MSRVLVIDDHGPSRKNLISTLRERSGYEVGGEGAGGAAGVALAASLAPHVTLMAVGLPDFDGIHAARKIMQAHPHAIVLLTSRNDAITIVRAKGILMERQRLTEAAAFALIKRQSMGTRLGERLTWYERLVPPKVAKCGRRTAALLTA